MNAIQEVFAKFYPSYQQKYKQSLQQLKAAYSIISCKTKALGARVYECAGCSFSKMVYNSCKNRHCPSCQGVNKEIWVDQKRADILDAPYFHLVFTVPEQLRPLIYQNQKLLYNLIYLCVQETLKELAEDKKYLGARIGFFSLLHTWGEDLHYHPHLHVVVLAGGLTKHNQWHHSSKKFFIPVKVLSKKFRGKFMHYLKQYHNSNQLKFFNEMKTYQKPEDFKSLCDKCYRLDWYIYAQETFSGPQAVIKYLGSYTHRIAVSNQRIVSVNEETVTILLKPEHKKAHKKSKTVTLKGEEFIRRFMMHVLPKGFVKIRYYGILANRNKKTKLALCRKLTGSIKYHPVFEGLTTVEVLSIILKKDLTLCPVCKKDKLCEAYFYPPGGVP